MPATALQQRLKPWVLPIAMVAGALFHEAITVLSPLVPYLIFTMLFITFCRIRPSQIRFSSAMLRLLCVQMAGSILLFVLLRPLSLPLAQSVFICVFCPTATAAPVVTGMLGGDVAKVATYSIFINIAVAVTAPLLFIWVGASGGSLSFIEELCSIAGRVAPLIVLPLLSAFVLYKFAPRVHEAVKSVQSVSFYLWAVSLIIVVGKSVNFILAEPESAVMLMLAMALLALLSCLAQFYIGRKIGARDGDRVSSAQSLGQKNTVLAIWMALTYFEPISSIGPAAYIIWQNAINSAQLYFKMKKQ